MNLVVLPPACWIGTSTTGTHGYYGRTQCTDDCGDVSYQYCYCDSACTPPNCPTGTTETNTGDDYPPRSCTNACGESRSRSCYCEICEPALCRTSEYYDSMQYDEWGILKGKCLII